MPNAFAYVVLFSYPLVVILMFRRMPLPKALIWSIMCGYLFLPERANIDLPMLPPFDKVLLPSLTAAIMCWIAPPARQSRRPNMNSSILASDGTSVRTKPIRQKSPVANICLFLIFIVPIGIALTNKDVLFFGPTVIGGIRTYDIFAMMLNTGVMLLPFFLARSHLTTPESHMMLLRAFVTLGLVYSALILIEVRLSPQLNRWIYGFHGHQFSQHIRGGGFRPMAFIEHGLRVALFMLFSVMATLTIYRARKADREPSTRQSKTQTGAETTRSIYLFIWLFFILYISKSLGAFGLGCIFSLLLLFARVQYWRFFAAAIALVILVYPMTRSLNMIPVAKIYEISQSIDVDRAKSLNFRLENEDILLDRASKRPLFGWGGWGRSRVYDAETGQDVSVTDGTWVIAFGVSGWFGYLAQFGLLTVPIFAIFRQKGALSTSVVTQGLCLMLAANLIDLIPNSGLTPLSWMMAGALLGRYEFRDDPRPVSKSRAQRPKVPMRAAI